MAYDFSWLYNPFFRICTQFYFLGFGLLAIYYAFKSRNYPAKKDFPKYFKNEIIIGIMFIFLAIVYPFIFPNYVPNEYILVQIYFHVWDSLTVHMLAWQVHLFFAERNNIKYNRVMSSEDWKAKIRKAYQDNLKSDVKRKLMHLIPPVLVIGMYYIGPLVEPYTIVYGWNAQIVTIYCVIIFGFHWLFLMMIFDNYRLMKFHKLGEFARGWAEDQIHPSELETYTSANLMMLAYIPFYFSPLSIVFTVVALSAISDAAASIVGKAIGKKRNPNSPKTIEGYVAGLVATYLTVVGMLALVPLEGATMALIQAMAIGAAFGFLLVDYFAKEISDNFLNPMVCGLIIWAVYLLFI